MEFTTSNVNYEGFVDEVTTCILKAAEVDNILKELKQFEQKKGEAYRLCPYKAPNYHWFASFVFCDEGDGRVFLPDIIKCTNKSVAARLYNSFLKKLNYHDTMRQDYCTVELKDNKVFITFCDY